jgi:hypothetical protein
VLSAEWENMQVVLPVFCFEVIHQHYLDRRKHASKNLPVGSKEFIKTHCTITYALEGTCPDTLTGS